MGRRCGGTRGTRAPANRTRRPGVEGSGGALDGGAHLAQRLELAVGGRREGAERLADAQVPSGRLAHLVDLDARVDGDELELGVLRARLEHPEVGDDDGRGGAGEAEPLAVAAAGAEADRRREVELVDEA